MESFFGERCIVKKAANHLHTNLLHDKKSINTQHKMRRLEYIESLRNDKKRRCLLHLHLIFCIFVGLLNNLI